MNNAYKWTRNAAKSGKRFLFVGTKKQASDVVAQEATRCGAAYVNQRWLGGMLTNWTTMKARIERLKDLEVFYLDLVNSLMYIIFRGILSISSASLFLLVFTRNLNKGRILSTLISPPKQRICQSKL